MAQYANPNHFGAPLDENQYMEQEEEWEREGLLDPAWEKQQRKVSNTNSRGREGEGARGRVGGGQRRVGRGWGGVGEGWVGAEQGGVGEVEEQ